MIVYDNVTGLKSVQNVENGNFVDENLLIGSRKSNTVTIKRSCCDAFEVDLNLTDVAGNSNVCHASINSSPIQMNVNWVICLCFNLIWLIELF